MYSHKQSTQALLVFYWVLSLPILAILYTLLPLYSPEAYEIISNEKFVVGVLLAAYLGAWVQLLAAQLQRSQIPSKDVETIINTPNTIDASIVNESNTIESDFISQKFSDDYK